MATNAERYAAIAAELLLSHPVTGAYSVDDATAASQLNAVNIAAEAPSLDGDIVRRTVDTTEYVGLSDPKKAQLLSITASDDLDLRTGSSDLGIMQDILAGQTVSIAALVALRSITVSRAEQLDLGTVVIGDIQNARLI